jgi:hypothetical protein
MKMVTERVPTAVIYYDHGGQLTINHSVESAEKEIEAIEKSKCQEAAAAFFQKLRDSGTRF